MTARDVTLPPQLQALKGASAALVRAFGGQEAAAAELGRAQSRLSDWGNPNTPDFMPVDVVLRLEAATHGTPGHPHVSGWLARASGHAVTRLPEAGAARADGAALLRALGEHAASAHAASEAVLAAVADGRVCAKDRAACDAEIAALISAAVALGAAVADAADAGGRV